MECCFDLLSSNLTQFDHSMARHHLAVCPYALILCCCAAMSLAGKSKPVPTPRYGWCRTAHKPLKAAQSGFSGYCKKCFKEKWPKDYAAKLTRRKNTCVLCGSSAEVSPGGHCKPCLRARCCDGCGSVNTDPEAPSCVGCSARRALMGAKQPRLAMWCPSCTGMAERATALCRGCYDDRVGMCHHCEQPCQLLPTVHRCSETGCKAPMQFCPQCSSVLVVADTVQCKPCWHRAGYICMFCGIRSAQRNLDTYRSCKRCIADMFCRACMASPNLMSATPQATARLVQPKRALGLCSSATDAQVCMHS